MSGLTRLCVLLAVTVAGHAQALLEQPCPSQPRAKIETGCLCGRYRYADGNIKYASFRGVPYAKAPTGARRFKKLERLDEGSATIDASNEGSICYQTDVLYGNKIMPPRLMSEDCIYANIHVPLHALPEDACLPAREFQPPRLAADSEQVSSGGLPILVFIHGGGFAFGSGDSDLHGPEYLVSKNVIVITFNYRLNVFGFLSLNSRKVPGNAGLWDMVTLLEWVQRNARSFGGDPDNVTLGGQSAGAISAHLLTLSNAAKGLFKRTIMMSGTAISSFFSPSPIYAQYLQRQLLSILKINATDPDVIYQQLVEVPADNLVQANRLLIDQIGLTTFVPTIETRFSGVKTMMDADPEFSLANGGGNGIPLLVGYTNSECETFRKRIDQFDIARKSEENPSIIIPPKVLFSIPPSLVPEVKSKIDNRFYNGPVTTNGFLESCTQGFFEYPVLKLINTYGKNNTAPIYVYKFSFENDENVIREIAGSKYRGAAHIEDMTYVFKTNSILKHKEFQPFPENVEKMKKFMSDLVVDFMTCSKPICSDISNEVWSPANSNGYQYGDIHSDEVHQVQGFTEKQEDIFRFYDTLTVV